MKSLLQIGFKPKLITNNRFLLLQTSQSNISLIMKRIITFLNKKKQKQCYKILKFVFQKNRELINKNLDTKNYLILS